MCTARRSTRHPAGRHPAGVVRGQARNTRLTSGGVTVSWGSPLCREAVVAGRPGVCPPALLTCSGGGSPARPPPLCPTRARSTPRQHGRQAQNASRDAPADQRGVNCFLGLTVLQTYSGGGLTPPARRRWAGHVHGPDIHPPPGWANPRRDGRFRGKLEG